MLLQHVIARIDQCNHASGVVKSINILASVRWVALAWAKVKPETIMKCFRKAGILRDDMSNIVTRPHESVDFEDPFVETGSYSISLTKLYLLNKAAQQLNI